MQALFVYRPRAIRAFVLTSDTAEFLYKTTDYCYPEFERSPLWDNPTVGVRWSSLQVEPQLAAKDAGAKALSEAVAFV